MDEDNALQAVVLADSFEERFRPVSLERPKALLPLCNVPLIEYTLEFLADAGVDDVVVFCRSHADQIESYLEGSRWASSSAPSISVVKSRSASNACQAIRELDNRDLIKTDPFVLVSGDVVANLRLAPIVEEHKQRRKKDKSCIMTMVLGRVDQTKNRIRPLSEELLVALDADTRQILRFENDLERGGAGFPNGEIFLEHPSVDFRYDLLDCNVDICTKHMVLQIADNYDYKDLRKDYIRNEVQNEELGFRIHAHELTLDSDYACRVRDLRTYAAISRDVLQRWLYPLVPDANWWTEDSSYSVDRAIRYKDEDVEIQRSCFLSEHSMVGSGSVIRERTRIIGSVVGEGCVIGKNVLLEDCFLWNNVTVEDNAVIRSSVVCDGVTIGADAVVSRGAVLSYNTKVSRGHLVPEFVRVAKFLASSGFGDSDNVDEDSDFGQFTDEEGAGEASSTDGEFGYEISGEAPSPSDKAEKNIVGEDGVGRVWRVNPRDLATVRDVAANRTPGWARDAIRQFRSDFLHLSGSIGCFELEEAREGVWDELPTLEEIDDDEDAELEVGPESGQEADLRFLLRVQELIESSSVDSQIEHTNVVLELNSAKYAENRTFADLIYSSFPYMLAPLEESKPATKEAVVEEAKLLLDRWQPSLKKLCTEAALEAALLLSLEMICLFGAADAPKIGFAVGYGRYEPDSFATREDLRPLQESFPFLLSELYKAGIVSDEGIEIWAKQHVIASLPGNILNSPVTRLVVQQILEDDEDDDEEVEDDYKKSEPNFQ